MKSRRRFAGPRRHSALFLCVGLLGLFGQRGVARAGVVPFLLKPAAGPANFNGFNGARSILVHGDTLYVGGQFTVTQGGVSRHNLAAFDLKGNLKPEFAPEPNGLIWALAADDKSLYVGGDFTRMALKKRLAAVDLVTGEVRRDFTAHIAGQADPLEKEAVGVRALVLITDTSVTPPVTRLLVGGNFTRVNSAKNNRSGLAALDPVSGDLDPARFTAGGEGGWVSSILVTADTVYVGGAFTTSQRRSTSLVPLTYTGALQSWSFSNGTQPVMDLTIDDAETRLFAGMGGTDNRIAALNLTGTNRGRVAWRGPRAGGDVQAVHYLGGHVYFGFHDGLFAEPDPYKMASVDASNGALDVNLDAPSGAICSNTEANIPNCWLPVMDQTSGQGFFGVLVLDHLVDPATGKPSLLVGGDFNQIGSVTNSRRFAIFPQP